MKSKIKVFIVEDEAITRASLESVLTQHGFEIAGSSASAEKALYQIALTHPDIILLDINLAGDRDGIWLANELGPNHAIPIIFLTAYNDKETLIRLKATVPSGYMRKPYDEMTLVTNIELTLANNAKAQEAQELDLNISEKDHLFVKDGLKKIKIYLRDIVFIKSDANYVHIVQTHSTLFIRQKLTDLLALLPPTNFIQVHRRYAVNVKYIESVEGKLLNVKNNQIPISKSFIKNLEFNTL